METTEFVQRPVTLLNGDYIAKQLREMKREWQIAKSVSVDHPEDTAAALSVLDDVINLLPDNLREIATGDAQVWTNVYRNGRLIQVIR